MYVCTIMNCRIEPHVIALSERYGAFCRISSSGTLCTSKLPLEKFPADIQYRRGCVFGRDIMAEQIPNCDIPGARVVSRVSCPR
jgi:hypothetical protein